MEKKTLEVRLSIQKILSYSLKTITTKTNETKTLFEAFAVAEGNKLVIWKLYKEPNNMNKYFQ